MLRVELVSASTFPSPPPPLLPIPLLLFSHFHTPSLPPLACECRYTNLASYYLADQFLWLGMRGMTNAFRVRYTRSIPGTRT